MIDVQKKKKNIQEGEMGSSRLVKANLKKRTMIHTETDKQDKLRPRQTDGRTGQAGRETSPGRTQCS